ncbi:SAM-dependent methyltransferase [Streptomyces albireticuli]|nr:SAM-dependent methyltransferase [Streptomyces albireticuli]MCD9140883.1 SAM-dependent methyltransferase [Streptomyces albireticuli]MCD9161155.1 SAM-dependent methyltransferase [Streptomyces albireticuli]MCD9190787.1 SAM-dependent methyltransferase [Streptomyces albireticuli]
MNDGGTRMNDGRTRTNDGRTGPAGPGGGPELPTGVSLTAVGIAAGRAAESDREHSLFHDPYARAFVDAVGASAVDGMKDFAGYVAVRTRFFDDYLAGAADRGCRQVVILAAGLDTRAFRLPWPDGARLFEVDLPELLDFKEGVLTRQRAAPACARTVLGADLRGDWPGALLGAGLDPSAPSAWLVEGLLPYLSAAENDALLDEVGKLSAPGSELAMDHIDSRTKGGALAEVSGTLDGLGAAWRSTLDDPAAWLTAHGWHVMDAPTVGGLAARYGRGGDLAAHIGARPSGLAAAVREG